MARSVVQGSPESVTVFKGPEIPAPDSDLARHREIVDAFFRAARDGDLDGLVALLDLGVVLRADGGVRHREASGVFHGAAAVAGQSLRGAIPSTLVRPALVNGAAGAVIHVGGRPFAVMGFTVAEDKIVEIVAIADPNASQGSPQR